MNKKIQSMIPGASLASTIKVLAGLGPLQSDGILRSYESFAHAHVSVQVEESSC